MSSDQKDWNEAIKTCLECIKKEAAVVHDWYLVSPR